MTSEEETPLVAALIATMNRPEFVREAITSVCEQSYDPLELVVVDASDDARTEEVVNELKDTYPQRQFTYVHNDTPRGLPAARNQAVSVTDAEYLAFLDDDDQWRPEKIERQMSIFQSGGDDLALVHTGYIGRDEHGSRVSSYIPEYDDFSFTDILGWNVVTTPSTVIVRRNALEAVGGFDETLQYCADWDFYIRVARDYQFESVSEPLVERTYHDGSMMEDLDEFFKYRAKLIEKHEPTLKAHGMADSVWKNHYRRAAETYLEAGRRVDAKNAYRASLTKAFDSRTVIAYALSSALPGRYVLPTLNRLSRIEDRIQNLTPALFG